MFSNTVLRDILFFICKFAEEFNFLVMNLHKNKEMALRDYIMILALGGVLAVQAQEEPAAPVFRPPFDFPLTLSGNFGELR